MDLINNPEFRQKYSYYKKIIKSWENDFRKQHGRIPSKHDIREADMHTKNAYKKYFQMKTAALTESIDDVSDLSFDVCSVSSFNLNDSTLNDSGVSSENHETSTNLQPEEVEPDNKIWGEHLNRIVEINAKESKNPSTTLTKKLSEKILTGSKFAKRNPRKSMSFSKQKSKLTLTETSFSQPEITQDEPESYENENLSYIQAEKKNCARPINLLQALSENHELKTNKNINRDWITRVSLQNQVEIEDNVTKNEETPVYGLSNIRIPLNFIPLEISKTPVVVEESYEIADIIENSESESEMPITQARKKRRIIPSKRKLPDVLLPNIETQTDLINISLVPENNLEIPLNPPNSIQTTQTSPKEITSISDNIRDSNTLYEFETEPVIKSKKNARKKIVSRKKPTKNVKQTLKTPPRKRLSRKVKSVKQTLTDEPESDEDPYKADSDNDPEFKIAAEEPEKPKPMKLAKVPKQKTRKSVPKQPENKYSEDEGPIDVTKLCRIKLPETVPRFKSIKTSKIPKNDVEITKPAKEEKQSTKNLNENFVRINIQKKVFARGKKTNTFQKHHKKQWLMKKKALALAGPDMDMGGCDGGTLKCFQCGGIGHFARQCKALKGEQLLPIEADNEEEKCPFPTLDEAYQSATKSKLSIHTTSIKTNDDNQEVPDEIDDLFDQEPLGEIDELMNVIEASQPISSTLPSEDPFAIKPIYELQPDGDVINTPEEVYEALRYFGFTSFRPGQEKVIMRILSGQSTLVTLSTGSGKSLCYQLPAYLYSKHRSPSIALVVSPLISLMQDQVEQSKRTICIHTGMTDKNRKQSYDLLKSGEVDSLLISPEAIVASLDTLIRKLPPISFVCIDEVHCVSQWSYNFRPSYLTLCRVLRERMGVKTLLGLTATAPLPTQRSIMSHLGISNEKGIIGSSVVPDNLTLTVSKDFKRDAALIAMLQSNRLKEYKSIIIYCTRRNECERIAGMLRTYFQEENKQPVGNKKRKKVNWIAEPYHAGLSASRRRVIQSAFMNNELRIVVATVAFGMGINKSDIRAVIHYNMPRNFESYVQEVGRAGRDGLPAHCHVFLDSEDNDQNELRRHIYSDSIDRYAIRKLLARVFITCECKFRGIKCPKHEVAFPVEETVRLLDIPAENISTLLCYLELHEKSFIQVLSNVYTWCKVVSYSGAKTLRNAAQSCAPLAMAIALEVKKGKNVDEMGSIEFPVVDVASAIGWDSGMVKCVLKNLEWVTSDGSTKRSTISVELSSLGFRVRAAGDLSSEDLDLALDYLYNRAQSQEKSALVQLEKSFDAFGSVATNSFNVTSEESIQNSNRLKSIILDYFQNEQLLDEDFILKTVPVNEGQICQDVRSMMAMYQENNFTGRALARIFHGIPSPNYPAVIWGRCKYWRAHINSDFNAICKIATQEIIRLR